MKGRTTLILLAVLLGLAAYVYFGEVRRPAASPSGTPTPAPLWSIALDQVLGLTVRSGEQETRLTRPAGGEWALEEPSAEPADADRVTQILGRLLALAPEQTFGESDGSAADYGLDSPSLDVTMRLADGTVKVLHVGKANPMQTSYYAQVDGSPAVQLIPDTVVIGLQGLLDEPPVRPTPTPTEAPTEAPEGTPVPTPES